MALCIAMSINFDNGLTQNKRLCKFAKMDKSLLCQLISWCSLEQDTKGDLLGSQMKRNETAISLYKPWIRGGLPADPGLLFLISYIGIAFHAYGAQVAAILIKNFTASLHSLTRGMTRPPAPPIGLKVEEAMTSAEIDAELLCPLRTPNFPPGTHDYDPKGHDRIEGVSECMISGKEAQAAKFNEFREAQGSHDEVYTDGSKMNERVGAAAVINRHFQNGETTCRQLSKRLQPSVWHWTITNTWAQSIMMW